MSQRQKIGSFVQYNSQESYLSLSLSTFCGLEVLPCLLGQSLTVVSVPTLCCKLVQTGPKVLQSIVTRRLARENDTQTLLMRLFATTTKHVEDKWRNLREAGKNGEKTSLVIKRYPPSPDRCVAIFGSAHRYQRETIKMIFLQSFKRVGGWLSSGWGKLTSSVFPRSNLIDARSFGSRARQMKLKTHKNKKHWQNM